MFERGVLAGTAGRNKFTLKESTLTQTNGSSNAELERRHRAALMTVLGMFGLTLLLLLLAFAGVRFAPLGGAPDPTLIKALWVAILFFGLGAVALRRTRFATMRLRDIAAVRGTSALLATLQNTTLLIALLGASIALMGFCVALLTGDAWMMLRASLIAAVVLLYAYPRRASWQRILDAAQTTNADIDAPNAKGTIA